MSFSHQRSLKAFLSFHKSLSDSKSPQVWIFLRILALLLWLFLLSFGVLCFLSSLYFAFSSCHRCATFYKFFLPFLPFFVFFFSCSRFSWMQDAAWKTCRKRWMIETNGEQHNMMMMMMIIEKN